MKFPYFAGSRVTFSYRLQIVVVLLCTAKNAYLFGISSSDAETLCNLIVLNNLIVTLAFNLVAYIVFSQIFSFWKHFTFYVSNTGCMAKS